ncbi:unnamed protein product [Prunus armeniaca]
MEEALCEEIDRIDCSPFTDQVERAPPPKRFTTPSITPFKGDSDPESRNFKEFALIFTNEYTSYKKVKKHADHLFNLRKKPDESLPDYLRQFKAEKANIIGCNDQVASLAFKEG